MEYINIGTSDIIGSRVSLGFFRNKDMTVSEVEELIETALENGINFFDHADIYGRGKCETLFGQAFKKNREDVIIQTKCGIIPGICYDSSKKHILEAVEGSLKRLNTDYIDILLLHRPDTLVEPEEVAEAFASLYETGKVKNFGVSNHTPYQIELLKKYVNHNLIINQLQLSPKHTGMIDQGIFANMTDERASLRDGGVLDYCRLNKITIQAWSPFMYGFFDGIFLDNDKFPELNKVLEELAEKYKTTKTSVVISWILRHPAKMQVISGTTKKFRIEDICKGTEFSLTREEWYRIYQTDGVKLP